MKKLKYCLFLLCICMITIGITSCSCGKANINTESSTVTLENTSEGSNELQSSNLNNITERFQSELDEYRNENGIIPPNNVKGALESAYTYGLELQKEGSISYIEKNPSNVYFELPTGEGCVYSIEVEGMASSGTSIQIYDFYDFLEVDTTAGTSIKQEIMKCYDSSMSQDTAILEELKSLEEKDALILCTHGVYTQKYGTLLTSGISVTKELDKYYKEDLKQKNIIYKYVDSGTIFKKDCYMITPQFFRTYMKEDALEGAIIYLGACSGGSDVRLANAFLSRGAKAVYAFTQDISQGYVAAMATTMIDLMKKGFCQEVDFLYPTVQQVLFAVQDKFGEKDNTAMFGQDTTGDGELIIYGDTNAKLVTDIEACFEGGEGIKDNPYKIQSIENLKRMAYLSSKGETFEGIYISIEKDIDGEGFTGIPNFSGILDGKGHIISNLKLSEESKSNGLFHELNKATIRNITIADSSFEKEIYSFVGAIAGKATSSIIENCYNRCDMFIHDGRVGGIVGEIRGSEIIHCENYGKIFGYEAGGIVGVSYGVPVDTKENVMNSIIQDCTNYGQVTGSIVGGIAGAADSTRVSSTSIIYCNNYGAVLCSEPAYSMGATGGILGIADSVTVSHCKNYGDIGSENDNELSGSIIGFVNSRECKMNSCENNGTSSSGELVAINRKLVSESNCINNQVKEEETTQQSEEIESSSQLETEECTTEEETTEEIIEISISGVFSEFKATLPANALTYTINVNISDNADSSEVESIMNTTKVTVTGPSGKSVEYSYMTDGNGGMIFATVSWSEVGTYTVTVSVGDETVTGTITVK